MNSNDKQKYTQPVVLGNTSPLSIAFGQNLTIPVPTYDKQGRKNHKGGKFVGTFTFPKNAPVGKELSTYLNQCVKEFRDNGSSVDKAYLGTKFADGDKTNEKRVAEHKDPIKAYEDNWFFEAVSNHPVLQPLVDSNGNPAYNRLRGAKVRLSLTLGYGNAPIYKQGMEKYGGDYASIYLNMIQIIEPGPQIVSSNDSSVFGALPTYAAGSNSNNNGGNASAPVSVPTPTPPSASDEFFSDDGIEELF